MTGGWTISSAFIRSLPCLNKTSAARKRSPIAPDEWTGRSAAFISSAKPVKTAQRQAEALLNVSIYTHQLCVLRPDLCRYARKSISDWKNIYLDECTGCDMLNECGGFFKWVAKVHTCHIHPIPNETQASLTVAKGPDIAGTSAMPCSNS